MDIGEPGRREPLHSFFTPDEIAEKLRALGFSQIDDHSAPDLLADYLIGSALRDNFTGAPPQVLRASRIVRASS
ncbi:hypothetical protein [Nocardia sp. NPDC051570]|uniref:hypothetical protein n=1 Tax=Nocardia sp. NPDC051570 TaxID=3364324 RepID=UPI0037B3A925